jgi:putative membrane protein
MTSLVTSPDAILASCHGAGWWPIIPILWFVFIVGLFIVIARFGWRGRRHWYAEEWAGRGVQAGKARLAERFASGEIDEQEYRARLAVLDESTRSGGGS